MDLRLFEYFLAVVDHGGVTKAAQALYIAQPSLSQAIRNLERQLGVDLFERSGRSLTLTPAGESLALTARRVEHDIERARTAVRSVKDLRAGRLEIAAMPTLDVDPLPDLAARLRKEHPRILLSVVSPPSAAQVVGDVRHGRAELGLIELPATVSSLRVHRLETQEVVLVLSTELASGLPDPVPVGALAGVPLLAMETGNAAIPGARLSVAVECAHRTAIWELVRQGTGAALLPRRLALRQLHDVAVRSVEPRIERQIGLVFRPGPLSPAARAFLGIAGG
ncbi:LysR family transcriptional regulator [Actinomadura viridis]|uniref:LysR family transcriptional regulator n=1 Tax=Actinomadura viridis TaxID=58110 RepID=UPI00369BFF12